LYINMAYDQSLGTPAVRAIAYDKTIKNLTEKMYVFKQFLTEDSTNAVKNYFWREDPTVLTGSTHNGIRGLSRGANFPQAVGAWEQILSVIEKFGLECVIDWEDIRTSDFDMQARQLYKVAEGIASAVDSQIWDVLTENRSPSSIQSVTVYAGWAQSSAAIMDDLEAAEQKIREANIKFSELLVAINPRDKRYIMKYLTDKGAQFPRIAENAVDGNGEIGTLGNKRFLVSNNVSASYALMAVPKICGTWKAETPLTTNTTEDPFKSVRVRGVEVGVTQVHQPKAIVLIGGTANTNT
jgi:hypothetical protein